MSKNIESELKSIIAISEKNGKISTEYEFAFFRIFLTAAEAKELFEIIQNYNAADDALMVDQGPQIL